MQLTTQMLAELESINTRAGHVREKFKSLAGLSRRYEAMLLELSVTIDQNHRAIFAELNPCKVRLENILCETDRKEQAHSN